MALKARYIFESNAVDISDHGNHGTVSGGLFVGGKKGFAWSTSADNSTEFINVPHSADLNGGINGAHCVAFWLYLVSSPGASRNIVCKGNSDTPNRAPQISMISSRVIRYRIHKVGDFSNIVNGVRAVPIGEWVHIVCQFSSVIGMEIYQNGVLDASSPSSTIAMVLNNQALRIGDTVIDFFATNAPHFFIDDLQFHDGALNRDEINALVADTITSSNPLQQALARANYQKLIKQLTPVVPKAKQRDFFSTNTRGRVIQTVPTLTTANVKLIDNIPLSNKLTTIENGGYAKSHIYAESHTEAKGKVGVTEKVGELDSGALMKEGRPVKRKSDKLLELVVLYTKTRGSYV